MSKIKTLLWLDDIRNPTIPFLWLIQYAPDYEYNEDGNHKVVWVKNYGEFVDYIENNELPTKIAFDHDLSDFQSIKNGYPDMMEGIGSPTEEKTGMDCAKYLVDYCIDNHKKLPSWVIQSANPVGTDNINSLLLNYLKYYE